MSVQPKKGFVVLTLLKVEVAIGNRVNVLNLVSRSTFARRYLLTLPPSFTNVVCMFLYYNENMDLVINLGDSRTSLFKVTQSRK